MNIFHYPDIINIQENVACIGYFDGVHLGHQALINKTIELANKYHIKPYVISFDGDFNILMNKGKELTNIDEKIHLLNKYGIEDIVFIKFDDKFSKTTKEDFILNYLNNLKINTLICGFDFTYGYKGLGNVDTLINNHQRNFNVFVVPKFEKDGVKVSSTLIKEELSKGKDIRGYLNR